MKRRSLLLVSLLMSATGWSAAPHFEKDVQEDAKRMAEVIKRIGKVE